MAAEQTRALTDEEIEASFRSSLKDVVEVAKAMSPHRMSLDDFVDIAELALVNDGQLRFIMGRVIPRSKR